MLTLNLIVGRPLPYGLVGGYYLESPSLSYRRDEWEEVCAVLAVTSEICLALDDRQVSVLLPTY